MGGGSNIVGAVRVSGLPLFIMPFVTDDDGMLEV